MRFLVFVLFSVLGIVVLSALGVWQVERRTWKLALIDRVDQRIHAAPVPAPGPDAWPAVNRDDNEYRRVEITGRFANDRETLVDATTERGMGFWVMTPLITPDGFTVLVNRGFVPVDRRDSATRAAGQIEGETTVSGLMRMTEPKGTLLRANDPAAGRWYSRDVAAIAKARDLNRVAPYFIDADATANPGGLPVGGLTVVSFYNHHLLYALTWFALALMLAVALGRVVRDRYLRK
ncbi:MAG TPA: SURF1 family protein [Hyphomicrobium sp.]|nr:SURF1 family protein [Hyphomicrobium sp.]